MAKKFKVASERGEKLSLNEDELAFYDALANNEASVLDLGDATPQYKLPSNACRSQQ